MIEVILFLGFVAGITVEMFAFFATNYFISINKDIAQKTADKTIILLHEMSSDEKIYPILNLVYWLSLIISMFTPLRWFSIPIFAMWVIKAVVVSNESVNFIKVDAFIGLVLLIMAMLELIGTINLVS